MIISILLFSIEDFFLLVCYGVLKTRPVQSTSEFVTIDVDSVFVDADYDPVADQIFWTYRYFNHIPVCTFSVRIGRANFDGSDQEIVLKNLHPGVDCLASEYLEYYGKCCKVSS